MNERLLVQAMGGLDDGPTARERADLERLGAKPRACRECMAYLSPDSPWDLCQFHLKSLELRQRAVAEGQAR